MYSVSVVDSIKKFIEIKDQWDFLLEGSDVDSIFLRADWLICWLEANSDRYHPSIIVVYDDDVLVGAAPYYKLPFRFCGVVEYTGLAFIGDYACGAEYGMWISLRDRVDEVFSELGAFLSCEQKNWDIIWMKDILCDPVLEEKMLKSLSLNNLSSRRRTRLFSCVNTPQSFESYFASISKKRRHAFRKLLKQSEVMNLKLRCCANGEELEQDLEKLFSLHAKRWSLEGEDGVFVRKPEEKRFYQKFAAIALDRGWLRLYLLEKEGEAVAAFFGYSYNQCLYQIQEGFDPEAMRGIGNLLRLKVFQDSISKGIYNLDFMGGFTEHKRLWRAQPREGCDVFVSSPRLKLLPFRVVDIWPGGRFLSARRGKLPPR